ncbi:MAG: hypothetical protein B6241_09270 [Spirochaetaceae bacterium 4572_59]|nr:MAG: hypothetical protein B6241_09270 [Spirochaetaceae bacterium 4572_59]
MRAEELVAEIYRQKLDIQNQGGKPSIVLMSPEAWDQINAWHISLGVMVQAPHMDYITENSIFGLSLEIEKSSALTVQ